MATLPLITSHFLLLVGRFGRRYAPAVAAWLTATSVLAQVPTITGLAPTRNARAAARSANVAITFSQPMSSAAATAGAVKVFSAQRGGRMSGTQGGAASVSGNTITFNPTTDFRPGETLFVSTTPAAQSSGGASLAAGHVHQFTTATGGTGRGNFMPAVLNAEPGVGDNPNGVATGDLDGDGDLDLVAVNILADRVNVRLNDGAGSYSGSTEVFVGAGPRNVVLGDVDGDGDLDILTANSVAITASVRLNNGNGTFSGGSDPVVGFPQTNLAVGDVNGDGDLDLLATYGTIAGGAVAVRLNDGTGSFSGGQNAPVGVGVFSVAVGDLDHDGDLDFVAVNSNDNSASVRFNDGTGTFSGGAELAVGLSPWSVALGDVDGDGDLDVLVANRSTNNVSVRLNTGTGTFSGGSDPSVGSNPQTVALGDVDADGDLDFVTANESNNTASVRFNDGTGTFGTGFNPAVGLSPRQAVLADVDGDGDLDLLALNRNAATVSVRLNQPPAPVISSFSPISGLAGTVVTLTGTAFGGVTAVAFNGTNAPAFTVDLPTQITVSVPTGAATGAISLTSPLGPATSGGAFTVLTRPVVTALSPTRNRRNAALTSNVAVTFDQTMTNTAATAGAVNVFSRQRGGRMSGAQGGAASVSGNTITFNPTTDFRPGETVFVTTTAAAQSSIGINAAAGHVHQFTTATGGTGVGTFVAPATNPEVPVGSNPQNVALGDVDGDGDLDFVTANNGSSTASVRLNDGTGQFAPATSPEVPVAGANARRLVLGDVDGDGDLDLLVANVGSGTVSVRINDGTGSFAPPATNPNPSVGTSPWGLTLGDVDGDGDLDLLTANAISHTVSVRLNGGTGNFTPPATTPEVPVGTNPRAVALGDIDGDGDLDLLAPNFDTNTVSVRLNDGTGQFAPPAAAAEVPVGTNPRAVALGDVDGDGDLDLLAANANSNTVSVRLNDGTGSFTVPVANPEISVSSLPENITLGDVDADGDLDFVASGASSVNVRLNDGTGAFSGSTTVPAGTFPFSAALGDLDGDGDLDLIVANASANNVSVRLNQVPAPVITSFNPTTGAVADVVTLTGTGFVGTTAVAFNGVNAPGFTVVSATSLTVAVPVGATTGLISLISPNGPATSGSTFTVLARPVVTALAPTRNRRNAPASASVSITFDQPMSNTAATAGALKVFSPQRGGRMSGAQGGAASVSGNTITFNPTTDFRPGETVLVTATPAAQSTAGVGPLPGYVYQFTAAAVGGTGNFVAPVTNPNPSVSTGPASVAVGDVDGDGDLDLLTANSSNTVSVRLNDGTGNYAAPATNPNPAVGSFPTSVALGDVDGDGDLDFVCANATGGSTVSVRLNDGTGNFTPPATNPQVSVGAAPFSVALGDVDGDGDLDFVTANTNANTVSVRLNDGTGNFTAPAVNANPSVGAGPRGVALADVDGDGDLDVLAANTSGNTVSVRLNDGTGSFAPPAANAEVPVGASPRLTVGDVDGDGDLDILTANNGANTVSVRLNNGTGSFTAPAINPEISVGAGPNSVALGHADGDGDLDFVTANQTANTVSIRLNDGTGSFTAPATNPEVSVSNSPRGVAMGDVDGDGDLDFLSAGSNTASVRLNQNAPPVITALSPTRNRRNAAAASDVAITFDQPMSSSAATAGAVRVFSQQRGGRMSGAQGGAASVSGNTITFNPTIDFRPGETVFVTTTPAAQSSAGANLAAGHVHQFTAAAGAGPAVFGGGQDLTVSANTAPALASGDVDGDGDADLVTINLASGPGTGIGVYLNNGTGTLAPHPTTPTSLVNVSSVQDMTLADIDGDGDLDLLIGERNAVRVLTNDGTGVFAQTQLVVQADDVNQVVVGDVDGDGDLDAATAIRDGSLSVLRNDGSGAFTVAATYALSSRGSGVAFGDIDGDGDLDLVGAASGAGGSGLVLRNDGTGTFGSPTMLPGGRTGSALADVDGDGDLDLLTSAGGFSGTVAVQPNDGTGTFGAAMQAVPVGNTPEGIAPADFDGDGDLDLLVSNVLGGTLSVRLNDGTGTFATTGEEIAVGSQSRKPVAVDLDGDLDLDVLAAGLFNNRVITRFNQLLDLVVSTPQNVPGGAYNSITVTGTGTADIGGPITVVSFFTVQDGGEVLTNCQPITGAGTFTLDAGATLRICDAAGISPSGATGAVQVTGARSFSADASYAYNGVAPQVTGNGLPAQVRELTAQNPNAVTITNPVAVRRVVTLASAGNLVSNGKLTLRSDATGTAMVVNAGAGVVTGAATAQVYISPTANPGRGYRHLSAPVTNTTLADLTTTGFTPRVNPIYNTNPTSLNAASFPTVFGYDETRLPASVAFNDGWYSPLALTEPMPSGRGYTVHMGGGLTPDFVGTLGTGTVPLNLTRTGLGLGNADKAGWYFGGNPYPAPLRWDVIPPAAFPPNMSQSVSVFRSTGANSGIYLTRVNGMGTLPSGEIGVGQALFLRLTSGESASFSFENAYRATTYTSPLHYRAAPMADARPDARPMVRLTLQSTAPGAVADATTVYFQPGATPGFDNAFDGPRPGRNLGAVPTLASLIEGQEAAINGLPLESLTTGTTTVELTAALPVAGTYTLTAADVANLPAGTTVGLLDRKLNVTQPLTAGTAYQLTATAAGEVVAGRFVLVFNANRVLGTHSALLIDHCSLLIHPNPVGAGGALRVLGAAVGSPLTLFDATGRAVITIYADATGAAMVPTRGLAAGVYVLRAADGRTARLVVE